MAQKGQPAAVANPPAQTTKTGPQQAQPAQEPPPPAPPAQPDQPTAKPRPSNPGKEAEEAERLSALLRTSGFPEEAEKIRATAIALRKMQEDALPLEVRIEKKIGRARVKTTQRLVAYTQ